MMPNPVHIAIAVTVFLALSQANAARAEIKAPFVVAELAAGRNGDSDRFDCPDPPKPLAKTAGTSMYRKDDKSKSKIDPEALEKYEEETKPVREHGQMVVKAANTFVERGADDKAIAACVVSLIRAWADQRALIEADSDNAHMVKDEHVAAMAFAFMQVAAAVSESDRNAVANWLADLVERGIAFRESRPGYNSTINNHRYWAGLAAAATGVVAQRQDLLEWGLDSARIGLRQITPGGFLPLELARGKKARHYHMFALSPLVLTAEIGAANGIDLYRENDGALHRLVKTTFTGIDRPDIFRQAAGSKQDGADEPIPGNRLAWLEIYARRYPQPEYGAVLNPLRPIKMTYLGGNVSLLFGPQNFQN